MNKTNRKKPRRLRPRKMKKFRSQILTTWLTQVYEPCRVADIGGGKGLLAYLLQESGWKATVIDPENQALPVKYTDLEKTRHKIPNDAKVPRINKPFNKNLIGHFDLLVGLHAHGVNMHIIEAAKEFNKDFFLLPCCVIDEPIIKKADINWRQSLYEYALQLGLPVKKVQFNFKGKNIAIYTDRNLMKRKVVDTGLIEKITINPIDESDIEEEEGEH